VHEQSLDAYVTSGIESLKYYARTAYETFDECDKLHKVIESGDQDLIVYYGPDSAISTKDHTLNVLSYYDRFATEYKSYRFIHSPRKECLLGN